MTRRAALLAAAAVGVVVGSTGAAEAQSKMPQVAPLSRAPGNGSVTLTTAGLRALIGQRRRLHYAIPEEGAFPRTVTVCGEIVCVDGPVGEAGEFRVQVGPVDLTIPAWETIDVRYPATD